MQWDTGKLLFNSSSLHLSTWHLVEERQEKAANDPATTKLPQQQGQPVPWRDGSSLGDMCPWAGTASSWPCSHQYSC